MNPTAQTLAKPLEKVGQAIDVLTQAAPGGSVVEPPATSMAVRAQQKERAAYLMGSVAAGGAAYGYLASARKLPGFLPAGKAPSLAAYSVAIFALLLAGILLYRVRQAEAMAAAEAAA